MCSEAISPNHEQVHSNIQVASERMKESFDINSQEDSYQPGDLGYSTLRGTEDCLLNYNAGGTIRSNEED